MFALFNVLGFLGIGGLIQLLGGLSSLNYLLDKYVHKEISIKNYYLTWIVIAVIVTVASML